MVTGGVGLRPRVSGAAAAHLPRRAAPRRKLPRGVALGAKRPRLVERDPATHPIAKLRKAHLRVLHVLLPAWTRTLSINAYIRAHTHTYF